MIKTIVFDVGRVLIEWNAKLLYRKVFKTDEEIDNFLEKIGFHEWNLSMDKGKSFDDGVAEKQAEFPEYAKEIKMYHTHWEESVPYSIDETVAVLKDLKKNGYKVYALTNFNSEKFDHTKKRFDFLNIFDGIVVSGEENMIKPDPEFFKLLCKRYNIEPQTSVFIDDSEKNIESAKELGFNTILFSYPEIKPLRPQLQKLGINI